MLEQRFAEKDWKLFRSKIAGWQESYMDRLVKDYIKLLTGENVKSSDKFWELGKRIREDKKKPAVLLKMNKSKLAMDIVLLLQDNVITFDDLEEFSDELKETVRHLTAR